MAHEYLNAAAHSRAGEPLNHLLAALSAAQSKAWLSHLVPMALHAGQVLCESGTAPRGLIFPTTAVVSLSYLTENGASTEFAVVGHDGVVGIALFMGGDATPSRAVVQTAGRAWGLGTQVLKDTLRSAGPVMTLLLRYTQALIVQTALSALCNRHHSIDQQLCRRLLMGLDRSPGSELSMTQEAVAQLLGVRREGVTLAASALQRDGVIRYRRGCIEVLDRSRLEQRSCGCYAVARKEYRRLMPLPLAA
jgi:CRP-like cAMP-binding protein